ncbi:MAG: MmgE/PrpD family protein, partial [Gammaproteobacteria bacterium]
RPGDNPRVDAQFSAQYCVANALVRGASLLTHFRVAEIAAPEVQRLIGRITCVGDPALDARGHSAVDVIIRTTGGVTHQRQLDIAPGYPGNTLSDEEHLGRFQACMDYARYPLPREQVDHFLAAIQAWGELADARRLLDDLIVPNLEVSALS